MSTAGLTQCTGGRKLRTLDQDSGSLLIAVIAVLHKPTVVRLRVIGIKVSGSDRPLPADTPARQIGQAAFTFLAVDILQRASAEVRTSQTSAADTACSEDTPAVILVATEVAAIPMAITTRGMRGAEESHSTPSAVLIALR